MSKKYYTFTNIQINITAEPQIAKDNMFSKRLQLNFIQYIA